LSRFEAEAEASSNFKLWKFVSQKAVTNPEATYFPGSPGIKCKELDQAKYVWDWRSKEHPLRCDYIEFSPL
jgi:hypothetical protein